tara:strand:+ start:343 stop:900 length:558 start_codon:yes stop_codon:yes gene_type:complete
MAITIQKKKPPSKTEKEGIFYTRQKGRCNYCGRKPSSMSGMQFDHVITPKEWKKSTSVNDQSNFQCLCEPCHRAKTILERKGLSDQQIRKFYKLLPSSKKAPTKQRFSDPQKYYDNIRFNPKSKLPISKFNKAAEKIKQPKKKSTAKKTITKKKATAKKTLTRSKKKSTNKKLEDQFLVDPKQFL